MFYRVEGIVIRAVEYGEGGVIITLYTGNNGKLGVMVRGAKKARSRHSAVTQLYTYGEYVFYKSGNGSLGTLNHAEIIDSFQKVRTDLRLSSYAVYLLELIDRIVPDEEGSSFLFEQLKASLTALNDGKDPQIVAHLLEMKLFQFAGISPELAACVSCGEAAAVDRPAYFSVTAGGLLCRKCSEASGDATPLSPGILKLLRVLQRTDLRNLGSVNVGKESKAAVKAIVRRWMDTHADIRLRTRGVLDQVEAVYGDGDT